MTNETASRKPLIPIIATLSFAGALVSLWQTHEFLLVRSGLGEMHSFCNIGQTFDCTSIEMSNYAEFLPGFPLSAFATAGYLLIFILALLGISDEMKKNLRRFLVVLSGLATLFSLIYLIIMVTQIGKLCLLCLGVDVINVALLIVCSRLPRSEEYVTGGTNFKHVLGAGACALLVAFLFVKGFDPQADLKKEDINDMIESVMNTPVAPFEVPADAPIVGDPNAKITIVKFSDFQCPACKMGATAIHPLFKRYPKDVRFVFVNFPLAKECNPDPDLKQTMHPFACEAAQVGICAQAQGKYLETYEVLFENQSDFKAGEIANLAVSKIPGLDATQLKACMALPSTAEKIKRDSELGIKLKVQSTPTFFLNGKKIEGGLPTSLWIDIIDKFLKKS